MSRRRKKAGSHVSAVSGNCQVHSLPTNGLADHIEQADPPLEICSDCFDRGLLDAAERGRRNEHPPKQLN